MTPPLPRSKIPLGHIANGLPLPMLKKGRFLRAKNVSRHGSSEVGKVFAAQRRFAGLGRAVTRASQQGRERRAVELQNALTVEVIGVLASSSSMYRRTVCG
jgi:polyribonucleotide nucleotidyltransferase